MKPLLRIGVFGGLLVGIYEVTNMVIHRNAISHLYPWDGDSIAIPIFGTMLGSFIAVPYLLFLAYLLRLLSIHVLSERVQSHRFITSCMLFLLYTPGLFVTFAYAEYWFIPNHYTISLCYVAMFAALLFFMAMDIRWVFSNPTLKRDCRKSAAAP